MLTIAYDDQAPAILTKINRCLTENGHPLEFRETDSEQEGSMAYDLVRSQPPRTGFDCVLDDFNVESIISKYGPEGCYILAKELQRVAQEDMDAAMAEPVDPVLLRDAHERFGIPCTSHRGGPSL